jgi:hypothetical protein
MLGYKVASASCKFLGKPCLIANYPNSAEGDYVVAGKFGAIWKYGKGRFFVLLLPWAYNKHIAIPGKLEKAKGGEEIGLIVNEAEARRWLLKLRIPRTRKSQLRNWEALHGKSSKA